MPGILSQFGTSNDTIATQQMPIALASRVSLAEVALAQAHGYRVVHQSMLDAVPPYQQLMLRCYEHASFPFSRDCPDDGLSCGLVVLIEVIFTVRPFLAYLCVLRVQWAYIVYCTSPAILWKRNISHEKAALRLHGMCILRVTIAFPICG